MSDALRDALRKCATLGAATSAVAASLRASGIEDCETEGRHLVCAAFELQRIDLLLRTEAPADPARLASLCDLAERRIKREPLSRILGRRGFWDLDIGVYPDVLDPRPDSEAVIEAAIASLRSRRNEPLYVLDIGTGSGALIAALLSAFPNARGWAIDVSMPAVGAARANLAGLGLASRASVFQQDWREPLPRRFDLVVSNPPYIESAAIAELEPEVRNHDPRIALDGGPDGLDAYRSLAGRMAELLNNDGAFVVEIGAGQAPGVTAIFESVGARLEAIRKDYGGHDRAMVWTGQRV